MKKSLLKIWAIFLLAVLVLGSFQAFAEDYIYKGLSGTHAFSFRFPSNWFARTIGDKRQGFTQSLTSDSLPFEILEFEGQTINQVVNYFVNDDTKFVEFSDQIFFASNEDMLLRKAIFEDIKSKKRFGKSFVKRGNIILAFSSPNLDATLYPYDKATNEIIKNIHNSLSFNDNWKTAIDFNNQTAFTYPVKFKLERVNIAEGIKTFLYDTQTKSTVFVSYVFPEKSILQALDLLKIENERLDSKFEESFNGYVAAIKAVFINLSKGKKQAYAIVGEKNNAYAFSAENTELNYPRSEYFNGYVKEMLDGVEFFNITEPYFPYLIFPDVRDGHPNAEAINHLANMGVIQGYEDKKFYPDNEINRAELTKMVVESVVDMDLSDYKNCFPDVKEEWFSPYICYAKEKNWISGYSDGKFKPSNKINRAEAMKIAYEVLINEKIENLNETLKDQKISDISDKSWFYNYFIYFNNREVLDKQHIIENKDGSYKYLPDGSISRKEVAQMIAGLKLF